MLDFNFQLNPTSSSKENQKNSYVPTSITETNSKFLSPGVISDTSPVYLFCTSKNGINSKNENGWTPIYRSIIANNLVALNELLKMGSDPNIGNNLGETPLYLCVDVDNYDALIILLQYNADTNISKRNGTTPLHLAAKKNKENYISALLRNNANPNLQNKLYSQTPTHLAIINKVNEDMLNIFCEHGADIYGIKDKYDKTPFDYAKELKDDEYVNLLIKIFGEKKEVNEKKTKTFNVNKIPEEISKKNEKILNLKIGNNFHNSGYNLQPETLNNIYSGEDLKKEDFKLETNNDSNSNNKSKKLGVLSSNDHLYSDKSISNNEESIKSKTDNNNIINIEIQNQNNLSEFQPESKTNENNDIINNNEIKSKNSLTKILKNNINIDTKMIDNSKDIIILNNNENNNNNNPELNKKNENENMAEENNEKIEIFINNENNENNNNDINEANNKILNSNNDRELIKNIISSTVKKIKVNTNTLTSEFSSNNNNSENNNSLIQNNQFSKKDYVKMINFSSDNNNENNSNSNTNNNITNLDNLITTDNQIDNGTSPFNLYNNQKKHENEIEIKNFNEINNNNNIINVSSNDINEPKDGLNDITPISNSKMNNNHSGNSNIFSEATQINALLNLPNNNTTQTEEEITNINKNKIEIELKTKEENNISEKISINSVYENNFYDASLEYSKSKSNIANDNTNNNISNLNNNIINQHHRQISYHNNNKSLNNKRKKEENTTPKNDLEENIIDKENENPNNNEIIYYNKNYLAGNNTPKQNLNQNNDIIANQKNNIIKKAFTKGRAHSDINAIDISNIYRYNSITNKTNGINQKIFTYTSPNLNKNTYLINTKLNFENNDINNNIGLNTNPNINISNLNETKDDFFSGNNNNFSSFLNTNKQNLVLNELKNNNSIFNVYDDINDPKNAGRKTDTITTNYNTINNNKNDKKFKNNEKHSKTNFRASSMGNTTLSSLQKNPFGTGKKSVNSLMNTGRNSNTNNVNTSNNMIKNIPVNILVRLRDWLISCDLLSYYNILIENNMFDIDQIISDIKNNNISLGYKDIEDLGIRKPGHIFRLLLKLEIDSGTLDNNIFNKILSKFTISCSMSNNIILTTSVSDIKCCGFCNKNQNMNSYNRTNWPYNDIFTFLKFKDLWKFKENFLHNGFDQIEYVLLQLFSKYKFNRNIMNDCLHIYSEKDKTNVLNKLYEEKISLAKECGLEYDENEFKEEGNNNQMLYNFSYSSSKKKSIFSDDQNQKGGDTNFFCNIF